MQPHNQKVRSEAIRLVKEEKKSMLNVSQQLGVSYTSVRSWVKRYGTLGEKGLLPNYSNNGPVCRFSEQIIEKAIWYKEQHSKWGAPFILIKLEDDFPKQALPSARRLQQIFKEKDLQPKRCRLPKSKGSWATQAFDRVQVDAKERLKTADGQDCCYLNFTDEYTGSELDAFVFPLCSNL